MKSEIESLIDPDNSTLEGGDGTCIEEHIKQVILETLQDESTIFYFDILKQYIKTKKSLGITTKEIALRSGLPEMTVKRFENLHTTPQITTVIKILASIGMRLNIIPIEK